MTFTPKTLVSALTLAALMGSGAPAFAHAAHASTQNLHATNKITQTDSAMRDLWLGHAFWVRAVVVETINGNSSAATAAENAAVANAHALAAALEPFYGKPASEKTFALLAGHYTAVKQYLLATKAKDSTAQDAARKAMFDNADHIAGFLSSANPHLPIDALRGMLLAHGGHHVVQIQQLQNKEYAQEVQTWEAMKDHMYGIADAMTYALAKQFPNRFK
jgi:REP element-mobilizing transposase RayT